MDFDVSTVNVITIAFSFLIGGGAGAVGMYLFRRAHINRQMRQAERKALKLSSEAEVKAKVMLRDAKQEADRFRTEVDKENRERRSELQQRENRLSQKEATLEHKLESVNQREQSLGSKEKEIENTRTQLREARDRELKQLEIISGLSSAEAKQQLLDAMEVEMSEEASRRLREWETGLKEEANKKAQDILSQAIQRSASDVVSEITTAIVPLPNDEMKGRLIGREGRNIRALEQATGVDLVIDDTPEAVTLSSFDPVRREVARVALNKLIVDGRIHPARIEEVVNKAKEEVDATIYSAGEQAAYEVGIHGLHPALIRLMGRLKFRTSYGQNVLHHCVEVSFLAGMIAAEVGADTAIAKKAGFLHDIGKAVDREVEGSHAAIGADLVKQWEKSPEVIQGVAEHHLETESVGLWGFLVSAADAISGARPGARRESLENYLKRLKALEDIADTFEGVDKSYAIQAGREIRVLVKPEEVDDLAAMRVARDIVKKIEENLDYPGQIKVTVLRETRVVDFAK